LAKGVKAEMHKTRASYIYQQRSTGIIYHWF